MRFGILLAPWLLSLSLLAPLSTARAEPPAQLKALVRLAIAEGTCLDTGGPPAVCFLEAFLKDGRRLPASPGGEVAHEGVSFQVNFLFRKDSVLVLDVIAHREVYVPNGETVLVRQVFVHYGGPAVGQVHAQELRYQDATVVELRDVTPSDLEVRGVWGDLVRLFLSEPA